MVREREVLDEILDEYIRTLSESRSYQSAYEGYTVIQKEIDELKDKIDKTNCKWGYKMRDETIRIAAAALRFIMDICEEKRG